jgi:hypothetical protein
MDPSGAPLNFVLDIDNGLVLGTEAVLFRRPVGSLVIVTLFIFVLFTSFRVGQRTLHCSRRLWMRQHPHILQCTHCAPDRDLMCGEDEKSLQKYSH